MSILLAHVDVKGNEELGKELDGFPVVLVLEKLETNELGQTEYKVKTSNTESASIWIDSGIPVSVGKFLDLTQTVLHPETAREIPGASSYPPKTRLVQRDESMSEEVKVAPTFQTNSTN